MWVCKYAVSVNSGFVTGDTPKEKEASLDVYAGLTALKRLAQPEEIGYAALFLASDEASYVTGAIFPVDGGYTAR